MKIFAHRGASREAAQNSLEAFQKALEIGVDGIECDCLLTKEQIPVVTHFDDLSILKLGEGFVREKTSLELKKLGIPRLIELLEMVRPSQTEIVLDLKRQAGWMREAPILIARMALEMLAPEQILLSSFFWRHLLVWKREFPKIPRALILRYAAFKLVPVGIFDRFFQTEAIHPNLKWVNRKWIQRWKARGCRVHLWVANSREEITFCKELGADGIFTDDPRFAKGILKPNGR